MSYFTAVLARDGQKWFARDVDAESATDLRDLTSRLRDAASDEEPVVLLVEREDAWWAVVRVDADEDARVFVSDVEGVAASRFAEVLEVAMDEDVDEVTGCAGDFDLLADLGAPQEILQEICDDELLPLDALSAIAEACGFAEVVDSLR